jgi:putative intracellular protease/amidase
MKIAFIIYDGMTTLDFVGAYEPLTKLKTMNLDQCLKWDICSFNRGVVKDQVGLKILANKLGNSLGGYDAVIVPGGPGSRKLLSNERFISWIKTSKDSKLKASVLHRGAGSWSSRIPLCQESHDAPQRV